MNVWNIEFHMKEVFLEWKAGIIVLAGITGFVQIWKFTETLQIGQMPGSVIFILLFIVAIYMVVHILLLRAGALLEMPEAEFGIVHIGLVFIKLAGELYAAFAVPMALGGGILIWFTSGRAQEIIGRVAPFLKYFGDYTFTGGIVHILGGLLYAFFTLIVSYILAELLMMALDVTMNIRFMRHVAEQFEKNK